MGPAQRLLDGLFPPRCAGCTRGPWPFCDRCRESLIPILPPWCARCGSPTRTRRESSSCRDCPPAPITTARAAFVFQGPARAAILRLKFSGWRLIADVLAQAMLSAAGVPDVDAVTWVPLSRKRLSERGFDQARALAEAAALRLDRPAVPLVVRVGSAGPQARRSAAERRAAMDGVFQARSRTCPPRILLVDDVLTTGATAASCAQALSSAGAQQVHLFTAARAFYGGNARAYTRLGPRPGLWLPGEPPR
jgi:ComF family protein